MDRNLDWPGCLNARDLGGLAAADGRRTRTGAVVRSDNPAYLTPAGWSALQAHGIRTIVALRTAGTTDDEPDLAALPDGVGFRRVVVEDLGDPRFVERCVDTGLWCTPVHLGLMLEHWPRWCAAGVRAVADAPPGGVVIACGRGCDRTGVLAALLLALVGVAPVAIADDWAASVERLRPREPEYEATLQSLLDREGTTVHGAVADALDRFDVAARLRDGGLTPTELDLARGRLLA
jgi:hypothetical protein